MSQLKEHRQAVLEAIYKLVDGSPKVMVRLESIYPDMAMSQDDMSNALLSLESRGYVFLRMPLGVRLTNEGVIAAEDGESTEMQSPVFNINNSSGFQIGNENVQHIQIGFTLDQVGELVDALRENGHDELAEQIDQEVVKPNNPAKLMAFFGQLITAVAGGGAGPVAEALISIFTG